MAVHNLGTVKPGTTIYLPFNTFDSNDPSASVTLTGLATTDIEVYKDGGVTQRASDAGYTLLDTDGIDFDGTTGIHGISIDLADNTTANFYEAGSQYFVVVASVTVDAAIVNFVLAQFTIGYPGALLDTTVATLASQTSFTLEDGSADDDAYNGGVAYIHDLASAVQVAIGYVSDYTGSTKTVTLAADPGIFTMAAGDNISLFPPANVTAWVGVAPNALNSGTVHADIRRINADTVSATVLNGWLSSGQRSTADSGTTTTVVDAALTQADDTWNGSILIFEDGSNANVCVTVSDFDAATDTITFIPAAPNAVTTENYVLIPGLGRAASDLANTTDGLGAIKTDTAATLADTGTDGVVIAAGAIDASTTASDYLAEINAEVDTALNTAIPTSPTAASINEVLQRLNRSAGVIQEFTIDNTSFTATTTAAQVDAVDIGTLEATDDHYNGRIMIFTITGATGRNNYQATDITDYDGTNKRFTYTALTDIPNDNDTFIVI